MRLFELERKDMPQIKPEDVVGKFDHKEAEIPPKWLTPLQSDRKEGKAKKARYSVKSGIYTPIIIDKNGYIIDGHHRWDAAMELGLDTVKVVILNDTYRNILLALTDNPVDENKSDQVTMKDKAKKSKITKGGESPHPFRGGLVGSA